MFFTPEDQAQGKPWRRLDRARRAGRYADEAWRVRKTGERFLAHITLDAIRDGAGEVTGFAKITRDITERRRQEGFARDAALTALELDFQRNLAEANDRVAKDHQRVAETLRAVIEASPLTDAILGAGPNGLTLADAATARRPGLKVLFTSGFAETALTANGQAVVSDRLLSNPYRQQDLLAKIAMVLDAA